MHFLLAIATGFALAFYIGCTAAMLRECRRRRSASVEELLSDIVDKRTPIQRIPQQRNRRADAPWHESP